jgi:putative tryptophan/tyrosine transport system substrate-binding protein
MIGVEITPVLMVGGTDEFDSAFATLEKERVDAVVVQASLPAEAMSDLALKYRLPMATSLRQYVDVGGLIS